MYVPPHFRSENEPGLLEFIRANSFDLLVSAGSPETQDLSEYMKRK